ncbi:molybdopterin-synthase adenylyltransferase MoeB [Paeniglutamicibacter kerguelensis]|uniref:Adenylyltransferase/sulfurtransferase n=1 Tax=Paeniglutamicibacter kerguelensis TaxID=254788 RepID=A0ABS4XE57_9MICC|nr:molybdopterin-synthase adenylyltransferase MoeB [Paeniglutamicibacter kerguelensis]MBP2386740.1 adenylyltransferase/sulfurtransferase [Paeniglutamicibacter kerguelensis]
MEPNESPTISSGTSSVKRPGPGLAPLVEPGSELGAEELMRYSRQIIIPEIGMVGQRRLKNAKVLVIGAGGLGSPALLYLAAAGVGTIGIIDDDVVDVSNLQRQVIHAVSSVGRLKTESAAARIRELNPLVAVRLHSHRLDVENVLGLFGQYDVILDGTDNFATRYLVNDAAALCGKPYVWGSILRFDGQVSVFWDKFGPNYRDLYPTPPPAGTVPSCSEGGVFGVLCAQVGSVMVAETIKLITGVGEPLLGRVLILDSLDMRWSEIRLEADPSAPGIKELLPSYEAFCAGPETNRAAEGEQEPATVSAAELAALLDGRAAGDSDFLLVDVREPGEHEIVSIPGAILAPRGAVLSGEITLPRDKEIILHCKSGGRSAEVLRFLRSEGYAEVRHLEGGILAWIHDVDRTLPAY